jgi:hypothetical protein
MTTTTTYPQHDNIFPSHPRNRPTLSLTTTRFPGEGFIFFLVYEMTQEDKYEKPWPSLPTPPPLPLIPPQPTTEEPKESEERRIRPRKWIPPPPPPPPQPRQRTEEEKLRARQRAAESRERKKRREEYEARGEPVPEEYQRRRQGRREKPISPEHAELQQLVNKIFGKNDTYPETMLDVILEGFGYDGSSDKRAFLQQIYQEKLRKVVAYIEEEYHMPKPEDTGDLEEYLDMLLDTMKYAGPRDLPSLEEYVKKRKVDQHDRELFRTTRDKYYREPELREIDIRPMYRPKSEYFHVKTWANELTDYLAAHQATSEDRKKIAFTDNMIMIQQPKDEEKFTEVAANPRYYDYEFDDYADESQPVRHVYLNQLPSLEAIYAKLDEIYADEAKPFDIRFSLGFIMETATGQPPNITYEYREILPHHNDAETGKARTIKVSIRDSRTLEAFREYICQYIFDYIHNATFVNSANRFVCIHKILFDVFRRRYIGGGIPGIETFIRNRYIHAYNEDNQLCMFAAFAYHMNPKIPNTKTATQHARALYKQFYGREYDSREYRGFDFSETKRFAKFFGVNVIIFSYDRERSEYSIRDEILVASRVYFHILVASFHIMHIIDIDNLTGFYYCNICHKLCKKSRSRDVAREHRRKHDEGLIGKKKIIFPNRQKPYIPHIFNNKRYQYALAYDIPCKPIRYYMTYDFETVEEKVYGDAGKRGEKSVVNSILHPLSVACCVRSEGLCPGGAVGGHFAECFDRRDDEWIAKWFAFMFANAPEIIRANHIAGLPDDLQYTSVPVLGFNSARFDTNMLISVIGSTKYTVKSMFGTSTSAKQIIVTDGKIELRFVDAMLYAGNCALDAFVRNFGDGREDMQKGVFPYEAISLDNYDEILSKTEPFSKEDFNSYLRQSHISDQDYEKYLSTARKYPTRWEYLRAYNIRDAVCMLSPMDAIIEANWVYKVDTLSNYSLSSNASSIKYALAYQDFAIQEVDNSSSYLNLYGSFTLSQRWFNRKCEGYRNQDIAKKRDVTNNIGPGNYAYCWWLYDVKQQRRCALCHEMFTSDNQPTIDRIDSNQSHTQENIQFTCYQCNAYKSNKDDKIMKLHIQLEKYARKHNLPMTLTSRDEYAYQIIRRGITGGMSYVMHRKNIRGVTRISYFRYFRWAKKQEIHSITTDNVMTHVIGLDFNSLYPSSFASLDTPANPYKKLYMPGRITQTIFTNTPEQKVKALEMVRDKNLPYLFIVEINAHIDPVYINEFVNMPPIFRKLEITTDRKTIGDCMYDYMKDNGLQTDKKESKLVMLLSTHGKYMSFSTYYLWFLLDYCHLVINDIRSIILFTKHDRFRPFVTEFMEKRIECIQQKSTKELYYKTSLNGSYGFDGMNPEKYEHLSVMNREKTFETQLFHSHVDTRRIAEDKYIVATQPKCCRCNTCIQEAYFTLDNAKFWYLHFIYNFLYECMDRKRFHFIEGDTDSMYWAVAGDPTLDIHQGFSAIITDRQFYDRHVGKWFAATKDLMKIAVEKEDESCIALSPKCYTLFSGEYITHTTKMKGVSKSKNHVEASDYDKCIEGTTVGGKNIGLQMIKQAGNAKMAKVTVYKNALTGCNTKGVTLSDHSCAPFVDGEVTYTVINPSR